MSGNADLLEAVGNFERDLSGWGRAQTCLISSLVMPLRFLFFIMSECFLRSSRPSAVSSPLKVRHKKQLFGPGHVHGSWIGNPLLVHAFVDPPRRLALEFCSLRGGLASILPCRCHVETAFSSPSQDSLLFHLVHRCVSPSCFQHALVFSLPLPLSILLTTRTQVVCAGGQKRISAKREDEGKKGRLGGSRGCGDVTGIMWTVAINDKKKP